MKKSWQKFEDSCYNYLVLNYGNIGKFTPLGESNSNIPDILAETDNTQKFYIEVKSPDAQCGQFVLLPNNHIKKFVYSPRNVTPYFQETEKIIEYMNENYDLFVNAGTKGKTLNMQNKIFYNWIKNYYLSKGTKFFITFGNDYIIFPTEKFDDYFDVCAKYRVKKSGSSSPGKSNISEIETLLSINNIHGKIKLSGKEFYLESEADLSNKKIQGEKNTYLFKKSSVNSLFIIRKLSNTHNANVIFKIKLKNYNQNITDLNMFKNMFIQLRP